MFDLKEADMTYKTAANMGIWPENREEDVRRLTQVLGLSDEEMNKTIYLKENANYKGAKKNCPFHVPQGGLTVCEVILK